MAFAYIRKVEFTIVSVCRRMNMKSTQKIKIHNMVLRVLIKVVDKKENSCVFHRRKLSKVIKQQIEKPHF